MKKLLFILSLVLTCCQADEVLDIDNASSIVVEGWLTDKLEYQKVKISKSRPFGGESLPSYVRDANVIVKVGSANYSFSYTISGVYISDEKFSGRIGYTHAISITLADGQIIQSTPEIMHQAPEIDSIFYESYERESTVNPSVIDVIYYPVATFADDINQSNHYRCKLYRNDTLFNDPEYMVLVSDRFFNGNNTTLENEFAGFEYALEDSVRIDIIEISTNAYNYLSLLKSQITNIGTVSSVTPSPIKGNLKYTQSSEEVLGFWGVNSIKSSGIRIKD